MEVSNGCGNQTSSNSVTVTVNNAPIVPTISTNGATSFCSGGSVQLSIPIQSGVIYQWKSGTTNVGTNTNTYTANAAGTYTVEVSNNCGNVVSSNSITVSITGTAPTAPTITASGATSFCSGDSVTLSIPTQTGVTYQWKNGTNNVGTNSNTFVAKLAGTYTVVVSNSCGSPTSTNSITIAISGSAPTVPAISANGATSFCSGGSVQLSIPTQSGVTYQWKNGTTNVGTNTNTYTANTAGTFTVELSNNCGTVVSSNTITTTITGSAPAQPTITAAGSTTICSGTSVALNTTAQSGVTYQWKLGTTNVGTNQNSYSADVAGVYTVEVSNGCGTLVSSNSITVTVNNPPTAATISANGNTSFCSGGSVQLSVPTQSGVTYQWKNGTTNVGTNSNTFTANAAGNYTVELTNGCGTTASANSITVTITGNAPVAPFITANGGLSFCAGDSVTLSIAVQSGVTYQWKNGTTNVGGNSNTFVAKQAGNYTVQVTNSCGSPTSTNSITVVITGSAPTVPTVTANGPTAICSGGSVQLSVPAQSGVTYQWKNGTTNVGSNSNTFTANTTGSYSVELSNNCGTITSSNSVSVTITGSAPTVPTIIPNGNVNFCQGGGVALEIPAQTGVTYQWKQGTTNVGTNSNSLTVTTAGTFTVVVSNGCGSVNSSNSITTTVNQLPATPTITANGPTTFCNGSVTLSAPAGFASYDWITGETTPSITVNASGVFSVYVTDANGCQSGVSNTITVSVNNAPVFSTINAAICSNQSYNFNGLQITQAGQYKDTLQTALGCDSIITLNLAVNNFVTGSFSQAICAGESFTFNGQILTQAGQYLDTLVSSAGCDSIVTLNLTLNNAPQPTITQTGFQLTTQVYSSYQWQLNGQDIPGANTQNFIVIGDGVYTVVVTDANGCSGTSGALNIALNGVTDLVDFRSLIYPNPANSDLMIEANEMMDEIKITDVAGRIVFTQSQFQNQKSEINISTLAEATYFIHIKTTSGRIAVKSFVKQ